MLRAAIGFFVLGLIAIALGATGIAGLSIEIGRTLLYVFLVLAVISFLVSIFTGRRTNLNSFVWIALCLSVGLSLSCSSFRKETDRSSLAPTPTEVTTARQAGASNVTEVNFETGTYRLTEGSREALKEMTEQAKAQGHLVEMKVLAWSDSDYPTKSEPKLNKKDRALASKRLATIRDYFHDELAVPKVKTYNMAKRPNEFQRLFNTSDAKTKNIFENAGITSADGQSLGPKTSHAIVMAVVKDGVKNESRR
jgi:uncharacterized membrane protein YtjA (UPF0391 family)